jgi:hypothetical protein
MHLMSAHQSNGRRLYCDILVSLNIYARSGTRKLVRGQADCTCSNRFDSALLRYLSNEAATQICIPSQVLWNTRQRAKLLFLYGRDLFEETTIDPKKTVIRDVMPRFIGSDYASKMVHRVETLYPLPSGSELNLPLPSTAAVLDWCVEDVTVNRLRSVSIVALLHDSFLYTNFLAYLRAMVSSENLLCARAIEIFKGLYADDEICKSIPTERLNRDREEMAWIIYRFFVASGGVYEVSVSHRRRKQVQQGLVSTTVIDRLMSIR